MSGDAKDPSRELVRAVILISGKVQGVFFRASAQSEAMGLGLTGEARNLPDQRVEVIAEGERRAVQELLDWCHRGPPQAQVEQVDVRWSAPRGEFRTFTVAR